MNDHMRVCPICGLENIAPDKERCPQCDADLMCFKVLDSLPETLPEERRKPKGRFAPFTIPGVIIILFGALLFFIFHQFRKIEGQIQGHNSTLVASLKSIDAALARLSGDRRSTGPQGKGGSPAGERADGPREADDKGAGALVPDEKIGLIPPHPNPLPPGEREFKEGADYIGRNDDQGLKINDVPPAPPAGTPLNTGQAPAAASDTFKELAALPGEPGESAHDRMITTKKTGPYVRTPTKSAPKKNAPPKTGFRIYRSNGRDTLWSLSERYYGAGYLYPVLMEHNPKVGLFDINGGTVVRILKDPGLAREIYPRIVRREGNRLYWHYTVTKGDSFTVIASRFLRHEVIIKLTADENRQKTAARSSRTGKRGGRPPEIADLKPGVALRPGQRVRIPLE